MKICLYISILFFLCYASPPIYGQGKIAPFNDDFITAISNSNDEFQEALPFPIKLGFNAYQYKSSKDLPDYFDLRGTGLIPPVKTQSSGGCWAYSSMSTLESRLLVLGDDLYDFSARNLQYCNGFDPNRYSNGNAWMTTAYFARQSGPLLAGQDVTSNAPNNDCPIGEEPAFLVRESRYPPNNINTIKELVMDVGSIWSLLYYNSTYFNDADDTYYYGGAHDVNHVLNIVGWDDNKVTVGGTGAWICQNTYGTGWGEDGFVYVSYNDSQFLIYNAYFPTYESYSSSSRVLLYDELGNYGGYGFNSETETAYVLVKFELSEDMILDKIGTYALAYGTTFNIEFYHNFNEATGVLSGLLASLSPEATSYPGLYTYPLDEQLSLNNGDIIYVKIEYTTPSFKFPIPIEYFIDGYSDPVIESDIAWVSETGGNDWSAIGDNTDEPYDPCINLYGYSKSDVTIWNGSSWDNGSPTAAKEAIIDGNMATVADIECNSLTINKGKTFNIDVNTGLTVNKAFFNNGTINVLSSVNGSGSLITKGSVNNLGTFNFQKYISKDQWHFISVPVSGITSDIFNGNYLQYWNEPDTSWHEVTSLNVDIQKGIGYSLWLDEPSIFTFSGAPYSGNVKNSLTYSFTPDESDTHIGANFMGNPYPSSIDWDLLNETYGAVNYWTGTQFASWNNDGGINGGTQYISPGQGFFLITTENKDLSLSNIHRTHSGINSYWKKVNIPYSSLLLQANGNGLSDELLIIIDNNASEQFEISNDALKLKSGNKLMTEIYSKTNEKNLSIDRRDETDQIQLGFECQTDGHYSFQLKDINGLNEIYLEDRKNGFLHHLNSEPYYFNWLTSDLEDRFILHFKSTGLSDVYDYGINSYISNDYLVVESEDNIDFKELLILDACGRIMYQQNVKNSGNIKIPFKEPKGLYLVRLIGNSTFVTKKVIN